jgi:OmpA-OmpF porin, OOP family
MQTEFRSLATTGFCAALVLSSGFQASGQNNGFYIKGDVGGNITPDIDMKEFFGVTLIPGAKVKLDPGFRAGFAGGYWFNDWFALEGELGFFGNNIKEIDGATHIHDASFVNVPLLFNARFQWKNASRLTPYIGGGAGFSESIFDAEHIEMPIFPGSASTVSLHGSDADTVFAYQGFAGLRFTINDKMGLSLEYRYFSADSATWHTDFTAGMFSDRMSFGRSQTHALSLAFDFKF